jgi:hypothetical protein
VTVAERCRIPVAVAVFPFYVVGYFFIGAKCQKIFLGKSFFLKNELIENILRHKTFYIEINRA